MATCPECKKFISQWAPMCPHCGYCKDDFVPWDRLKLIFHVLANSPLANIALFIGQIVAILGCIVLLAVIGVALFNRAWTAAFIGLLELLLLFTAFVVLQRASDKD